MSEVSSLQILFYIPNIIGYARFMLLVVSIYYALSDDEWIAFTCAYSAGYILDAVDGHAARAFN